MSDMIARGTMQQYWMSRMLAGNCPSSTRELRGRAKSFAVRESLEDGEITPDEFEAGADPIYYATITMPHGPFQFERNVKLG